MSTLAADPDPLPDDIGSAAGVTTGAGEVEACHVLLREMGWGVLSVIDDAAGHPYAVPVAYAFDGEEVYVATGRGRKLRALERNPAVCLTVLRLDRFDCWRSVVIMGRARWVTGALSRAAAARAFLGQHRPGGYRFGALEVTRMLGARVFRIAVDEMSTRSQGTLSPGDGRGGR